MEENKSIKKLIRNSYRIYQPKLIMYSFRINKEILDGAKKEAKKLGVSTSVFVRQAIIEKMESRSKLDKIEKRLKRLENKI